jgi:hypothetical protein
VIQLHVIQGFCGNILRFLKFLLVFPSIFLDVFINMIPRQAFLANWDPAVQWGISYIYIQYISYNWHCHIELKRKIKFQCCWAVKKVLWFIFFVNFLLLRVIVIIVILKVIFWVFYFYSRYKRKEIQRLITRVQGSVSIETPFNTL